MINALIVDDEIHARQEMQILLEETGVVTVVGTCGNGIAALKMINQLRPEVLFLDIHMPVVSGFELLSMIHPEIMPHVVFVTAFDQYALKAFEEKALDYLLKPVDSERLGKTITKLQTTVLKNKPQIFETEEIKRIPCLSGNRIILINVEEIEYVAAGPAGVHITTGDGEFYTEVTLKVIEEKTSLVRCHKQYLINLDKVREIVLLEGSRAKILSTNGQEIPVSRRILRHLKKRLMV